MDVPGLDARLDSALAECVRPPRGRDHADSRFADTIAIFVLLEQMKRYIDIYRGDDPDDHDDD